MKLNLILCAALVGGVISSPAATQPVAAPAATNAATTTTKKTMELFDNPVIAKGKGFEIKQSELDQVMTSARANAAAQGQQLPQEYTVAILNQLITIHSLLQKATDADRAAGRAEADLQFDNMVKRSGSQAAFERQLKAIGMTADDLRANAAQSATARITLKRELKINVTDADIKAFYDKHSADFEQPEMAHVRHILLMTVDPAARAPLATNTVAAKRKQIDDLLKQARAGSDFAELATKYSEDPGSKINGGELPDFAHGQMVPEFEAAAFALTNGQVSEVVTTVYGFHIIKMIGKTPAKKYTLNDTLPLANKSVAEICKNEVEGDKIKDLAPAYVKNLRKELGVEVVDPALKSMDDTLRSRSEAAQAAEQAGPSK